MGVVIYAANIQHGQLFCFIIIIQWQFVTDPFQAQFISAFSKFIYPRSWLLFRDTVFKVCSGVRYR